MICTENVLIKKKNNLIITSVCDLRVQISIQYLQRWLKACRESQ